MGASRTLAISGFASTTDLGEIASKDVVWSELIERLANKPPEAASKSELRLLKLARFGDKKNPRGKGSYRWNGNVLHLSGIIAEHDAGKVSLDDAAFMLEAAGIEAFLYTTPSHMKEGKGPRWRVMAPLSVDTPPEQHTALVDKLNGALDGALAPESWVLTQIMYYGRVAGSIYETQHVSGAFLDLVDGITPIGKREPKAPEPVVEKHEPASADEITVPEWAVTHINGLDPDCDYDTWRDIGMRLHEGTDGGDDGFNVWNAWSAKSETKYPGEDELRAKWETFGNGVGPQVTLAGLRQQDKASVDEMGPPLDQDVLAAASAVEKQKQLAAFEWRDASWIVGQPDPVWIVYGLIPQSHDLVFFAGVPGVGKSFLALDVSLAIVRGVDWFGADTEQGAVGYIAAEAFGTFQTRLRAYMKQHNVTAQEIAGFKLLGAGVNLADAERMKLLGESARAFSPRLLVVDTLAAAAGGIDHNSSEMQKVIDGCKLLQRATGATVLMVAHHGKDESKGIMGWQGLTGNAETICVIAKDEEKQAQTRYFKVHKQRNGIEGVSYKWMLEAVALGTDAKGREIASAVPRYLGVGAKKPKVQLGTVEQVMFDIVMEHDGELSRAEVIEQTVAKLLAPEGDARDRRRENAQRALRALVEKRRMVEEHEDRLHVVLEASALASPDEVDHE